MPKGTPHDLTGQQFTDWTVLRKDTRARGDTRWWCRCACGTEASVQTGNLLHGKSKRCTTCGHRYRSLTKRDKRDKPPRLTRYAGELLADARRQRGLTQQDLANILYTTTSTISRCEIGDSRLALDVFVRLCHALETDPATILTAAIRKEQHAPRETPRPHRPDVR